MIRRSPCEQYLKFLLVHPDHYTPAMVREIVLTKGLDYIGEIYAKRLLKQMRVPDPFKPYIKTHGASQSFMMREGIIGFFWPTQDDVLAHQLLENAKAKELVETLSLACEKPEFIVAYLERREGIRATSEALRRYFRYYWNLNVLDKTELRALMRMRSEVVLTPGVELDVDELNQRAATHSVRYRDPRRLIVESPITAVAAVLNRMRLGVMPSQLELSRMAAAARVAATARTLESLLNDHREAAADARDYSQVSKSMTELIQDLGSPDAELKKELQQLQLETDHSTVPHIAELSAGHHTTDLSPQALVDVAGGEVGMEELEVETEAEEEEEENVDGFAGSEG